MRALRTLALFAFATAAEENPGLLNWFTTELTEVENKVLNVSGTIPSYVNGLFAQAGPGRYEIGGVSFGHALDGFSKVNRIKFDTSGSEPQVTFSTSFLQSRFYKESLKANTIAAGMTAAETTPATRRKRGPFNGMGPNDNNYIKPQKIGGEMAMTSDTLYFEVMNDDYSEIKETVTPDLPGTFRNKHFVDNLNPPGHLCIQATMAHGIPDEAGGFTVTMGCQTENVANPGPLGHYHVLFRIDPHQNNKRELIAQMNLGHRRPSYMHHNGHTESSHVIIATPMYMDFEAILEGKGLAEGGLVAPEGDTALFQVVSKKDGSVREFETDGFLTGHVVNSYDDGDDIVVDLTYSTTWSGGFFRRFLMYNLVDPVKRNLFEKCTLMRYRLKADGTVERSLTLPDEPTVDMELPMVHPDFEGKQYCVFWGVQFTAPGKEFGSFAVLKRNVCTGESITAYREGLYPSEHRFIPRPGGTEEDDGALVGLVYDGVKDESFIEVLDAKTLKQLGKADFGMKIPFAVHTTWFGADAATHSVSV